MDYWRLDRRYITEPDGSYSNHYSNEAFRAPSLPRPDPYERRLGIKHQENPHNFQFPEPSLVQTSPSQRPLAALGVRNFPGYRSLDVGDRTSQAMQPKPKLDGAKSSVPRQNVVKTRITISDDLSTDDDKKNRRLLALKPKTPKPTTTSHPDISGKVFSSLCIS